MSETEGMDANLLSRIAADFAAAKTDERNSPGKSTASSHAKIIKALLEVPAISGAFLIEREEPANGLTAYLSVRNWSERPFINNPSISAESLYRYLQAQGLSTPLPRVFVYMEKLPCPAEPSFFPVPDALNADYAKSRRAAATETEKKLSLIWEELLEKKDIPVDGDFFRLGGHSLLAVQLLSRVYKEFGVEIPVKNIFSGTALTIAFLAEEIEKATIDSANPAEVAALLTELDNLTEEQIKALLAGEENV